MNTTNFGSELFFDKSYGIFAQEDLSSQDLEIIQATVNDLRKKVKGLGGFIKDLETTSDVKYETIRQLREKNALQEISIETGLFKGTQSKLLEDIQLFLGHDWAQLADFTRRNRLDNEGGSEEEKYEYYISSYTAILICFESALSIITGKQQTDTIYSSEDTLKWFKSVLDRRFLGKDFPPDLMHEGLKRRGLLDRNDKSVYDPFRIHIHSNPGLQLPGSAGASLLMSMYNWAKNSITVGEMRGRLYYDYVKDPFADAYAAMLEQRIQENGGCIDVHMEVFETPEAYIGCVSDTGAGFDLNSLKKALYELTKDEEQMTRMLRLGIISGEMIQNIKEWETDPRAYGKIISDLPSLLKMPRFSSANSKKLELVGMNHSGIGLFGIEVAARQHFATTFITEQRNGGACMIQVIPKNPDKYKNLLHGNPDSTRKKVADVLFQTPPHLKEAA